MFRVYPCRFSSEKLVEAKMKTTAEPHVKEELNHMQAMGRPGRQQLQNDIATGNGPEEISWRTRSRFSV